MLRLKEWSSGRKAHFFISVTIGILIIFILSFYEKTGFGEHAVNKVFDHVILKESEESVKDWQEHHPSVSAVRAGQLAFVDLGSVYRRRDRPLLTPRDEIARAINTAQRGGASVIVLDILFEEPDCCRPGDDRRLRAVLEYVSLRNPGTRIIFPVRIDGSGTVRKNIYDDLIDKYHSFYRAVPYLSSTSSDRVIRYWVPYEAIKHPEGIIWNASLLAAALACGKERELNELEGMISAQKGFYDFRIPLEHGRDIAVSQDKDDIYKNRVRFFLVPPNIIKKYPSGNIFEIVSEAEDLEFADFKGKVVVIGNSDPEAGDIHHTAVGAMPGMYVIGNALNTMLLGLQPRRPPLILNMMFELSVIIGAAFYLSRFPPLLIKITKGFILLTALSILSYYYFKLTGTFLNVSFALAAMGFHDIVMSIEKAVIQRKQTDQKH